MSYLTEKELLERYQFYTLQIEEQLQEGEDFDSLSEDLPAVMHLSDSETLKIIEVNSTFTETVGYELEEIQENWFQYLTNTVHPNTIGSVKSFLPDFYQNDHPSRVKAFLQYARLKGQEEYLPFMSFTKASRLPCGRVLWIAFPSSQFGEKQISIEQVIKMDEFKLKHFQRFQTLTNREIEILRLLANGYDNPAIAERLFLSRLTVETHRKNLKRKLEIVSVRDLMRYAYAFNLVEL